MNICIIRNAALEIAAMHRPHVVEGDAMPIIDIMHAPTGLRGVIARAAAIDGDHAGGRVLQITEADVSSLERDLNLLIGHNRGVLRILNLGSETLQSANPRQAVMMLTHIEYDVLSHRDGTVWVRRRDVPPTESPPVRLAAFLQSQKHTVNGNINVATPGPGLPGTIAIRGSYAPSRSHFLLEPTVAAADLGAPRRQAQPTAAEFQALYPHDPLDLGAPQTTVRRDGNSYVITNYDEKTGMVRLEGPTYLAMEDLTKPQRRMVQDMSPGDAVDVGGVVYRLVASDGRVGTPLLMRDSTVLVHWGTLHEEMSRGRTIARPTTTAPALPQALVDGTGRLGTFLRTISGLPTTTRVPRVGRDNVVLVSPRTLGTHDFNYWRNSLVATGPLGERAAMGRHPAIIYVYALGRDPQAPQVRVILPASRPAHMGADWEQVLRLTAERMLADMPATARSAHQTMVFNPGSSVHSKAAATADPRAHIDRVRTTDFYIGGDIEAYRAPHTSRVLSTFYHETGHQIANMLWDSSMPHADWRLAMSRDGQLVSDYGATNLAEDFAEATEQYLLTDGGRMDPSVAQRYRGRFAILDRLLGTREYEHRTREILAANMHRLGIVIVTVGSGYMLVPTESDEG